MDRRVVSTWAMLVVASACPKPAAAWQPPLVTWGTPRLQLTDGYLDGGAHPLHSEFVVDTMVCNVGDDVLRFMDVMSSCSCVTVDAFPATLGLAECGTVSIRVATKDMTGRQEREITLVTNDPHAGRTGIQVVYEVGSSARANPVTMWFGVIEPGSVHTQPLKIEGLIGKSGEILYVASDNPAIKPVVVHRPIEDGNPGQLDVTVVAPVTPSTIEEYIRIHTTIPGSERISVAVRAAVSEAVVTATRGVDLGAVRIGERVTTEIPIKLRGLARLRVLRTRPHGVAAWLVGGDGREPLRLGIEYANGTRCGPFTGAVGLAVEGPEKLRFEIPVRGEVVPAIVDVPAASAD